MSSSRWITGRLIPGRALEAFRRWWPSLLGLALGCLVAAAGLGIWQYTNVTHQYTVRTRMFARQNRALVETIKRDIAQSSLVRRNVNYETCRRVNKLTRGLRFLIISSTKASKAYERFFLQFGLPNYHQRLLNAYRQAATFKLGHCIR